jgi:hypothetical protein
MPTYDHYWWDFFFCAIKIEQTHGNILRIEYNKDEKREKKQKPERHSLPRQNYISDILRFTYQSGKVIHDLNR